MILEEARKQAIANMPISLKDHCDHTGHKPGCVINNWVPGSPDDCWTPGRYYCEVCG